MSTYDTTLTEEQFKQRLAEDIKQQNNISLEDIQKQMEERAQLVNEITPILRPIQTEEDYDKAQEELIARKLLSDTPVDLNKLKNGTYLESGEGTHDLQKQVAELQEELKNTKLNFEAIRGVMGQLVPIVEQLLPFITERVGDKDPLLLQIQQVLMIGKALMAMGDDNFINSLKEQNDKH